ncbi:Cse1-domain-containing protein [Cubamyces lactineus]|nr:Cse1-domain-containing protein [Cubamyces lactineus]
MGGLGVPNDAVTCWLAAAEVLRALVSSGLGQETTEVTCAWIGQGLNEYAAIYLLTAVATRGSTTQHSVASTNALIDVVQFFSGHVFQDLQAEPGSIHPILQDDAIRFLYTLQNQLVKPQPLSVLPSLVRHLSSENYVCRAIHMRRSASSAFCSTGKKPAHVLWGVNEGRGRHEVVKEVLTNCMNRPPSKNGGTKVKKGLNASVAASANLGHMKGLRSAAYKKRTHEEFLRRFSRKATEWVEPVHMLTVALDEWANRFGRASWMALDVYSRSGQYGRGRQGARAAEGGEAAARSTCHRLPLYWLRPKRMLRIEVADKVVRQAQAGMYEG